jgi:predicted GIY-YIG superfamily endonuclease
MQKSEQIYTDAFRGVINNEDILLQRVADPILPCSNSGYVYLIVSIPNPEQTYLGTTENISVRINQHNQRCKSHLTTSPVFLPWAVVCYMSKMDGISHEERMDLEGQWQTLNSSSNSNPMDVMQRYIENGRRVVEGHNALYELVPTSRLNYIISTRLGNDLQSGGVTDTSGQVENDDIAMEDAWRNEETNKNECEDQIMESSGQDCGN